MSVVDVVVSVVGVCSRVCSRSKSVFVGPGLHMIDNSDFDRTSDWPHYDPACSLLHLPIDSSLVPTNNLLTTSVTQFSIRLLISPATTTLAPARPFY